MPSLGLHGGVSLALLICHALEYGVQLGMIGTATSVEERGDYAVVGKGYRACSSKLVELACMPMLLPPEEVDFCPVIASRQTKLAIGSR